jgi:hypothetical protein
MKHYFLFIGILILTLVSCKKSDSINSIEPNLAGSWRMVLVNDISNGSTMSKPSFIYGEVDITFTFVSATTGTMKGVTPTNILNADYSISDRRTISIPAVSATKVKETSWGRQFLDNVTTSQNYFFDNYRRLNINTSNKILTFQRL